MASSGFSFRSSGRMFVAHGELGRTPLYDRGSLVDLAEFGLHPAAAVLSYGVSCFEGLKAYRQPDESVALFRVDKNGARLKSSAEELGLPAAPPELFIRACREVVATCLEDVPPAAEGTLYLRPLLFGTEPLLGVAAGKTARFHVFACPVSNYFAGHNEGEPRGLRLRVMDGPRVAPGGLGNVKCSANYAATLRARRSVHEAGDDECLYLDANTHSLVEESASSNVFAVFGDRKLVTPPLSGTILPGVTRDSLISIARDDLRLDVEERDLPLAEVLANATEFFLCGTAVVVAPATTITLDGRVHQLPRTAAPVATELRNRLLGIQLGRVPDRRGWLTRV